MEHYTKQQIDTENDIRQLRLIQNDIGANLADINLELSIQYSVNLAKLRNEAITLAKRCEIRILNIEEDIKTQRHKENVELHTRNLEHGKEKQRAHIEAKRSNWELCKQHLSENHPEIFQEIIDLISKK